MAEQYVLQGGRMVLADDDTVMAAGPTPPPEAATAGMLGQSTAAGDPSKLDQATARMNEAFGLPVGTPNRFLRYAQSIQEHPVGTAALTAAPFAIPALPGAGRVMGAAASPVVRGVGRALANPTVGAGLGAAAGYKSGGLLGGLLGGLAGRPAIGRVGRAMSRVGAGSTSTAGPAAAASRGAVGPTEGVAVERLFQDLSRRPILSPAEQLQLEQLQRMVGQRASQVGLGYASGGRRGLPK